jgi:hypothetical protein
MVLAYWQMHLAAYLEVSVQMLSLQTLLAGLVKLLMALWTEEAHLVTRTASGGLSNII